MNVRLKHHMNFTAGVYFGGEMRMNHYTATLYMITNSNDATHHNIAFERIKYFVYGLLDSTIFINQACQEQCQKFAQAGLTVTTMPGEPVDQLIGLMLYYKLNAIMEDRILVHETEISSTLGENMIYAHSDDENTDIGVLPEWWTSCEPTHNDFALIDKDKILTMHANTAWREMDLSWPEPQFNNETGNIVVFADFKPNHDSK